MKWLHRIKFRIEDFLFDNLRRERLTWSHKRGWRLRLKWRRK
jgi:hypothetical protein